MTDCLKKLRDVAIMVLVVPPAVALITAGALAAWVVERTGGAR